MSLNKNELSELPNIGGNLALKLNSAGINTKQELYDMGSEAAFLKLKTIDNDACLNMLCALEGAVQDIRWHKLDKSRMLELKEFYNQLQRIDSK